jgi:hypothetical protein
MNHLHWPKAFKHSDEAAADLQRCIQLQESAGKGNEKPYFLRPHIALGDAHVKSKQYDKARQVWQDALDLFAEDRELLLRLEISDDGQLLQFVLSQRSLDLPVDTDLSFLDAAP